LTFILFVTRVPPVAQHGIFRRWPPILGSSCSSSVDAPARPEACVSKQTGYGVYNYISRYTYALAYNLCFEGSTRLYPPNSALLLLFSKVV
jgi:hypothetical protein